MVLASIDETIVRARAGDVVSFPTDTVPALAVVADHADKIYQLKGRSRLKPLILMGASVDSLQPFVVGWHPAWQAAVDRGWPGPLTLVVPASDRVPAQAISDGDSVGIRIPASPTARQILTATGPLATTSANLSGSEPLTSPHQIEATFPSVTVLDRPFPQAATPSTVVRWCETEQTWEILRQGAYRLSD
ncbi:MAG: L-threonylcarbamoyladenylate synthase [Cyanobacteria bacterium J06642_12]